MLSTILMLMLEAQYPPPEPRPYCQLDPGTEMVFYWAETCPTHTLRFEYRDDGTFRVVCLSTRNANKLYPKR